VLQKARNFVRRFKASFVHLYDSSGEEINALPCNFEEQWLEMRAKEFWLSGLNLKYLKLTAIVLKTQSVPRSKHTPSRL
jgi:hypothetical protein